MSARRIRIAVDIGGTFTDLECPRRGDRHDPQLQDGDDAGRSLDRADERDQGRGRSASASRWPISAFLMHGTTIATNAVLTRNLPRAR